MSAEGAAHFGELNTLLSEVGLKQLDPSQEDRFGLYLELLLKWNERMNLTAVRDRGEILRRHFVECIGCAQALPAGIGELLDFGSGAGFPGIPIAICRPEIAVTLAESQAKKAAFLNEVVRTLDLKASVFAGRAESIVRSFDCVTLRAVDRMDDAIRSAVALLNQNGRLAVMTTQSAHAGVTSAAGEAMHWQEPFPIPGSDQKILLLGSKRTQHWRP
jgi:16S rRNA (guanine527-N7)-methyltransferase